MSLTVSGRVKNSSGKRWISSATVRLYRRDTGVLLDSDTSDSNGNFSITGLADYDPYNLFALAYTTDFKAAIADIRKYYFYETSHIYGELLDSGSDILTIEPPYTGCRLLKVQIESTRLSNGTGQIDVRNASGGGGSGISVSITNGLYKWTNTGEITTSDYFYVYSADPGANLSDVSIILLMEHPKLVMKPLGGDQ